MSDWIKREKITEDEWNMVGADASMTRYRSTSAEQLPLVPFDLVGLPTVLTRTALFGLPRRGKRKHREWDVIASRGDVRLTYYGSQLDQADLELWLFVLRLTAGQAAGSRAWITRYAVLKELKKPMGGSSYGWLERSLNRLTAGTINLKYTFKDEPYTIVSSLMGWGMNEHTDTMFVRVPVEISVLFKNLTYLDFECHLALPSSLSKSLHVYASGHRRGHQHIVQVDNLCAWFGYDGNLWKFRAGLCRALQILEQSRIISDAEIRKGARGEIVSWKLLKKDYNDTMGQGGSDH